MKWYFPIIYHIVGWGFPFIVVIIGIIQDSYGNQISYFCATTGWLEVLVGIITSLCVASSLIFIILILIKIIRVPIFQFNLLSRFDFHSKICSFISLGCDSNKEISFQDSWKSTSLFHSLYLFSICHNFHIGIQFYSPFQSMAGHCNEKIK